VIATGTSTRQLQAICDEIAEQILEKEGRRPISVEGYDNAEWVLMDYGEIVIHIFTESARKFYDLERLWRLAKFVDFPAEKAS
jgi:ribosome-associated protein